MLQPWIVCGLFCLFFWLPSRNGLLHWSGCCPTSTACWPSPDPNNKVTLAGAKINVSLQLPAPTADASMCIAGYEAERQCLFPPLLWSVSALSPGLFYSGEPSGELFLNALYFERCEVFQRELAVKWTEAENRVYDMEAACIQSWFTPAASAFGAALARVGVHVSVSSRTQCAGCAPVG